MLRRLAGAVHNALMDLLISHRIWLMGQDEQLLRPRAPGLRTAVTAAALFDVIRSGAASWTESGAQVQTCPLPHGLSALVRRWAGRLEKAAADRPLETLYAIDALAPDVWDDVGSDAALCGVATDVSRPIRRWMQPRHRPDTELARKLKTHLRDVVRSPDGITDSVDEAVLAAGWSAGVLDELLSLTALTDPDIVDSARTHLQFNELVRRIDEPVNFLSSARVPPGGG